MSAPERDEGDCPVCGRDSCDGGGCGVAAAVRAYACDVEGQRVVADLIELLGVEPPLRVRPAR